MITWHWGSETNVVFLNDMSQHQLHSITDWLNWFDGAIMIWKTTNHTDITFVIVCGSKKNYVFSACSILCHLSKILCPRWKTICDYKASKFSVIWLQEEYKKRVTTVTVIKVLCFGRVRTTMFVKRSGKEKKVSEIWHISGHWTFSFAFVILREWEWKGQERKGKRSHTPHWGWQYLVFYCLSFPIK